MNLIKLPVELEYLRYTDGKLRVLRNGTTVSVVFYSKEYAESMGKSFRRYGRDRGGTRYTWKEDGTSAINNPEFDIVGFYETKHGQIIEIDGKTYRLVDEKVW
jgi:hypothetical protein